MRRYPTSFLLLTGLGILCAIPGAISLAGFGASLHPVLDDPMAGLAFIVSAVALIGSGAHGTTLSRNSARHEDGRSSDIARDGQQHMGFRSSFDGMGFDTPWANR